MLGFISTSFMSILTSLLMLQFILYFPVINQLDSMDRTPLIVVMFFINMFIVGVITTVFDEIVSDKLDRESVDENMYFALFFVIFIFNLISYIALINIPSITLAIRAANVYLIIFSAAGLFITMLMGINRRDKIGRKAK